jgi:LytS/YehU family sensor histidine kinase
LASSCNYFCAIALWLHRSTVPGIPKCSVLSRQAELRALQARINPHCLFNALNTLYGIIPRSAPRTREMVLNLSEIFRYFLRRGSG